jgi:ATP-dependent Lon protease
MTGEITIRGNILEIGGLKEKAIAAHRAGLKTIIIPKDNIKSLVEIPKEVKKDIKFIPVEHYDEIYPIVFGDLDKIPTAQPPKKDIALAN